LTLHSRFHCFGDYKTLLETTKTFPILSRLLKPLLPALSVCALGVFIPAVSAATLEAHYPFEEGNGATTADVTTNHADATLVEDYVWSTETPAEVAASTQSLDLQANNAERGGVTLPASVSTGVLDVGPFSISVWARSHKFLDGNPPGGSRVLLAKRDTGVGWPDADWYYQVHQSDFDTGELIGVDFGGNLDFPQALIENGWHHYVVTHDANKAWTVYVDGVGTTLSSPNFSIQGAAGWPLHVGWDGNQLNDAVADPDPEIGAGKWHWNGEIDDLRVYSGELTAQEVLDLFGGPPRTPAVLEAHYPFEEGNGTTTEDLTGNHADATVIEDVAWSSETPQFVSASTQSLDLQANNAERGGVTLPDTVSTGVLEAGAFSISLWARSHKLLDGNPPGGSRVLLAKRETGVGWPNADFYYQVHHGDFDTGELIGPGFGGNLDYAQTVTENAWHHYVVTHNGVNIWTVYLDNVPATQSSPGNPSLTASGWPLHVGWDGNQANADTPDPDPEIGAGLWHWNGEIDELRIYSGELTAAQVSALYGGPPPPGPPPGVLQAYYPFEEGAGTTTADATGNHADATIIEDFAWSTLVPSELSGSSSSLDLQANNDERGGVTLPLSVSTDVLEAGPFSISVWARCHLFLDGNPPAGSRVLLAKRETGVAWPNADWYYQVHHSDYNTGELIGTDFGGNIDYPQVLTDNTWHHFAVTHDGKKTWTVFVDGMARTADSPNTSLQDAGFGALHVGWDGNQANTDPADPTPEIGGGLWHWNGEIDDLAIFSNELSAEEVAAVMSGDFSSFGFTRGGPRLTEVSRSAAGDQLTIKWESRDGKLYNLRSDTTLSADPATWAIFGGHQDMAATPPENVLVLPFPADPERYFVIEEFNAPPVEILNDDFESGQGDWIAGSEGQPGSAWELGAPTNSGPAAANSPSNCFGTNIAGDYGFDANLFLRSPPIDLTTAGGATLSYFQFYDIEADFDGGRVAVLDAGDNDSEVAVLQALVDGEITQWEKVTRSLPAAALGKVIRIEFRLTSDDVQNHAGWYIDDVLVTVP